MKKDKPKLASVCANCINWEAPDAYMELRLKRKGWCCLFDKETDKTHGLRCTAFEPWPGDKIS